MCLITDIWLIDGNDTVARYLVQTNLDSTSHYMTEPELLTYDNGELKLKDFRDQK